MTLVIKKQAKWMDPTLQDSALIKISSVLRFTQIKLLKPPKSPVTQGQLRKTEATKRLDDSVDWARTLRKQSDYPVHTW
jgi:hypothetical protein